VHKFHRFHTVTNHFYISRPIFLHRPTFDGWPQDLQRAMQAAIERAVALQRESAIEEDRAARAAILAEACEITELTAEQHAQFRAAVAPLTAEARGTFGRKMFEMV
jgi:TRAP-type C4-dicarboxylate transport system substrate-binding protein